MTQKYHVQLSMNQSATVLTGMVFKQGDFGFQLEIEVMDFDNTGTTPQIVFRKNQGAVESTDLTVVGNVYTYTLKGTELDTPGIGVCDLKLKNSTTQRISTASFQFEVIADTLDGLNEHANSYSDTIGQIWETLQDYSETSEAWAVGERNGVPVDSSQEQYHNNSKYYAELSGTGANTAQFYADKADDDVDACQNIYNQLINAMGLGTFIYDPDTGNLYYDETPGTAYTFSLIDGYLYVDTITA